MYTFVHLHQGFNTFLLRMGTPNSKQWGAGNTDPNYVMRLGKSSGESSGVLVGGGTFRHQVFPWLFDDVKRSLLAMLAMLVSIHQWRCHVPNQNLQKVFEKPKWHTWDAHLLRKWVEPYCFCTHPEQADGWNMMKWSAWFRQRCVSFFLWLLKWFAPSARTITGEPLQVPAGYEDDGQGMTLAMGNSLKWHLAWPPIWGSRITCKLDNCFCRTRNRWFLYLIYTIMYMRIIHIYRYTYSMICKYTHCICRLGVLKKTACFQADFVAPRASWDLQRCGVKQHKSSA